MQILPLILVSINRMLSAIGRSATGGHRSVALYKHVNNDIIRKQETNPELGEVRALNDKNSCD